MFVNKRVQPAVLSVVHRRRGMLSNMVRHSERVVHDRCPCARPNAVMGAITVFCPAWRLLMGQPRRAVRGGMLNAARR